MLHVATPASAGTGFSMNNKG